jgi:DNA-binding beta-propeller fold protein YncE
MHTTVRRTASRVIAARRFSTSSCCNRALLTLFSIVSALFLLATTGARAQAISGAVSLVPVINTVAGNGTPGFSGDGGPATNAEVSLPRGMAVDSAGDLYIADYNNNRIRKVTAATGIISTVAGNGTAGYSGDGGPATGAELNIPTDVAVDSAGNLYIADLLNSRIRKVAADTRIISTVAGSGTAGDSGDDGPATSATISSPTGVAVDSAGNIYIADYYNNNIRKVTAATGIISTVAGNGTAGFTGDGGAATSAELKYPKGVAVDSAGNLYIADYGNNRIRLVTAATGNISTIVGNGTSAYSGDGGPAASAEVSDPYAVALDNAGNLYIADYGNNRIRKVTAATGDIDTVTGNGIAGYSGDGGAAASAEIQSTFGLAVDNAGNVYVGDDGNNRIREVNSDTTFPATAVGATSASQNVLVQLTAASAISSITVPKAQNGVLEFTVGTVTGCVMNGTTSNAAGTICTVPITFSPQYPGSRTGALTLNNGNSIVGTVGLVGMGTGPLGVFEPGAASVLNVGTPGGTGLIGPEGVAVDGGGDIFIADTSNQRVVEVATSGAISVLNTGSVALNYPYAVAIDAAGNLYIANGGDNRVVKVTPAGVASVLSTGGLNLNQPEGVAVDGEGNVYIADTSNQRVVKVGIDGSASVLDTGNVALDYPYNVALDDAGDVYVANGGDNRVVRIAAVGGASVLNVGTPDGIGLLGPQGVAADGSGTVYIADTSNQRIVEVTAAGAATVFSTGSVSLSYPYSVALDGAGDVYIANGGDNRVVEINRNQQSLAFATTNVGQTSSDSPRNVTVQNIGNQPLLFTDVVATTNFNLNGAGTTCLNSTTLAPGATCGLGVEFAPIAAGALTGTVNITDNNLNAVAPNNVQRADLSGTGVGFAATIALAENPGISVVSGTAVTVTATLTGSNGVPTGNITYTLDGTLQPSVSLSNGVAQFTLPATLAVGTHSVVVSYAGDADYAIASPSQSFTLTVTAPASVIAGFATPSITVAPGASATDVLTITPVNGYTGTVQFSCTGLPAASTCSFQPTTVALGSSPVKVTLTVQTTAPTTAELRPFMPTSPGNPAIPAGIFWLPGCVLAAVAGSRRKLSGRGKNLLILLLLLGGMGAMTACGGGTKSGGTGTSGTPAGTSTVQVLVTGSGNLSQTVNLNLTVQ